MQNAFLNQEIMELSQMFRDVESRCEQLTMYEFDYIFANYLDYFALWLLFHYLQWHLPAFFIHLVSVSLTYDPL